MSLELNIKDSWCYCFAFSSKHFAPFLSNWSHVRFSFSFILFSSSYSLSSSTMCILLIIMFPCLVS